MPADFLFQQPRFLLVIVMQKTPFHSHFLPLLDVYDKDEDQGGLELLAPLRGVNFTFMAEQTNIT